MSACAHCGRDPAAGFATGYNAERLCHPDDPGLPDCYRRVTAWREPLGKLLDADPKPAGVEGAQGITTLDDKASAFAGEPAGWLRLFRNTGTEF